MFVKIFERTPPKLSQKYGTKYFNREHDDNQYRPKTGEMVSVNFFNNKKKTRTSILFERFNFLKTHFSCCFKDKNKND